MKPTGLTPTQRLIVAADFKPETKRGGGHGWVEVRDRILALADELSETGVTIKVNSGLRAIGYELVQDIRMRGLAVFADLKLNDISETLSTDGTLISEISPEILTVMCNTGSAAMAALKARLPRTEVLGVTVLTSVEEDECLHIYGESIEETVDRLAFVASKAKIDGLIASGAEAKRLRTQFGDELSINTPAIRPAWAEVAGDDQNKSRVMTPTQAFAVGVDRIVVGRPIVRAENPRDAVMRTIDEIAAAFA